MSNALTNSARESNQRKEKIVNFLIDEPKTVYNKPDWRYSKAGMHRPGRFRMKDVELTLFDDIFISPELNCLETVGFYHKKLMATYGIDYEKVRCQINGENLKGESVKATFAGGEIGAIQLKFYHDFSKMKPGKTQDVSIVAGEFKKNFTLSPPRISPHYYVTLQTMIRSGFIKQKLLAEWIDYYLSCGVEHFYIYDNGINEKDMGLLNSYTEVTVVDWDKTSYFWMEYDLNKKEWISIHKNQPAASTHCIQKYGRGGQSKWMIFVDPDEFLYSPTSSLLDVLKKYENDNTVSALTVHSYLFAGFPPILTKSIAHDCIVREKKVHSQIKSIVKPEFVENHKVHGASNIKGKKTKMLDIDELRYNHYKHIGKWRYVRKGQLRGPVIDRELSDIVKRNEKRLKESSGDAFDFFEGIYCINPTRNR
ncbi:MAG: glycosyltransferase family 92 protein, partial [archaeon]|nr:glycosyltransferase family 92 protein [archaeon]